MNTEQKSGFDYEVTFFHKCDAQRKKGDRIPIELDVVNDRLKTTDTVTSIKLPTQNSLMRLEFPRKKLASVILVTKGVSLMAATLKDNNSDAHYYFLDGRVEPIPHNSTGGANGFVSNCLMPPTSILQGNSLDIHLVGAGSIAHIYLNELTTVASRNTDSNLLEESDADELEELLSQMSIQESSRATGRVRNRAGNNSMHTSANQTNPRRGQPRNQGPLNSRHPNCTEVDDPREESKNAPAVTRRSVRAANSNIGSKKGKKLDCKVESNKSKLDSMSKKK